MKSKLLTVITIIIFAVIFLAAGEADFQEAKTTEAWASGCRTETAVVVQTDSKTAILETTDGNQWAVENCNYRTVPDFLLEILKKVLHFIQMYDIMNYQLKLM